MRAESNLLWRFLLGGSALALLATSALAGEITLYHNRDFGGDTLTLRRAEPDIERIGFNDSAASVVIREGMWEVCTDPYYRGNCTRLQPGDYRALESTLHDRIASAREIVGVSTAPPPPVATVSPPPITTVPPPVAAAPPVVAAAGPRITLFEQPGFAGRAVEITETHGNLSGIPEYAGASAVIVYGGTWRLCTRQYYRGQCEDFAPGRYDSLGGFNGRVVSAELVSAAPGPVGVITTTPPAVGRVVLYELPDFGGQSLVVERNEMPNLDLMNFGDRAASLRVESGYWMVCTDIRFRGTCRTFGPGEYPRLSPDVDHKIASLRRSYEVYGALSPR